MPLSAYTAVDAAGKPLLEPEEAITFTSDNTRLFLRADKAEGEGTLFVTTKHLIWLTADRSAGYRMDYPYLLLHAVCRDTSVFPHPCLYAQLDDEVAEEAFESASMRQVMPNAAPASAASSSGAGATSIDEDGADDDEDDEPDQPISDLRFVPENPAILDALYKAVSECAALNPDSDLSDGEGDFMYNADEIRAGMRGGMADGDNDEDEYGEGGDDGAAGYGGASSAEARLARMLGSGMSAHEMFANDEDEEAGEDEDGEEEEEEDESKAEYKKGQPDDGAAQLASAAQQVKQNAASTAPKAAAAAAASSAQKRERPEDDA